MSQGRAPVPAGGLLHPAALIAVAVLIVNDHAFKGTLPPVITGKLSDVAGLVFFPLALQGGWETVRSVAARPWGPSRGALAVAIGATGVVFAAIQLSETAMLGYEYALGALQWPLWAALAAASGEPLPGWFPVAGWSDPTDLLTLPALAVAWMVGSTRCADATTTRGAGDTARDRDAGAAPPA